MEGEIGVANLCCKSELCGIPFRIPLGGADGEFGKEFCEDLGGEFDGEFSA